MTGIIAIQNYQVIMYRNLGMTNTIALTLTAVWGTLATISAVLTTFFFDKLGRKPVIVSEIHVTTLAGTDIFTSTFPMDCKSRDVYWSLPYGHVTKLVTRAMQQWAGV